MEERERSESSGEVAVVGQPANGLEVTGFWIYCKVEPTELGLHAGVKWEESLRQLQVSFKQTT